MAEKKAAAAAVAAARAARERADEDTRRKSEGNLLAGEELEAEKQQRKQQSSSASLRRRRRQSRSPASTRPVASASLIGATSCSTRARISHHRRAAVRLRARGKHEVTTYEGAHHAPLPPKDTAVHMYRILTPLTSMT